MAELSSTPSLLVAERVQAAFGDQKQTELSLRAGTWLAFRHSLITARKAQEADDRAIFTVPRSVRNSGVQLSVLFKNWKPCFAGFFATGGAAGTAAVVSFSPTQAEKEWNAHNSMGITIPDFTHDVYIVPLEEIVVVAALAALQVYARADACTGTFSLDEVYDLLTNEAHLALGRSRVPGSVTSADIAKILSPPTHGGVGIADVLCLLSEWHRNGGVVSLPLPPGWISTSVTMAVAWPQFFTSPQGAIVIPRSMVGALLAGAAEREIYVTDAGLRAGPRSDGCLYCDMSCIHSARSAHRCTRRFVFEM